METRTTTREALIEHAGFINALARRLTRDTDLADDLAQETLTAALEHPPRRPERMRAWLATTLRRFAGRREREHRRRRRREEAVAREEAQPSSAEVLADHDRIGAVASAVLELDDAHRDVIVRRFYLGHSAARIAREDSVPAATVRSRIHRAIDALRAKLDRKLGEPSTWGLALARLAGAGSSEALPALREGVATGLSPATLALPAAVAAAAAAAGAGVLVWIAVEAPAPSGPAPPVTVALSEPHAPRTGGAREAGPLEPPAGADEVGRVEVPTSTNERSGPASASQDRRPRASLRFVDWRDRPAANRRVATDSGRLARTDARGRLTLAPAEDELTLYVERPSAPSHRVSIVAAPGEQVVRLPRGEELAGIVVVDGLPPARPLELTLYPAESGESSVLSTGDELTVLRSEWATTTTSAGGAFAFRGLSPTWTGYLRVPPGHARLGEKGETDPAHVVEFHFERPAQEVVLELERFPSLHGTIVRADGTAPREAGGTARMTWLDETNRDIGFRSDVTGFFEFFLPEEEFRSVRIDYGEEPGGLDENRVVRHRAEIPADGDLGRIVLAPTRVVELVVTSPEGTPIEGARTDVSRFASDAGGAVRLEGVSSLAAGVEIVARGFVPREIRLAPGDVRRTVVLRPTNELVIEVVDAAGAPLAHREVEITAPRLPFFPRDAEEPLDFVRWMPGTAVRELHDGGWHSAGLDEDGYEATVITGEAGRVSFGQLRPLPLTLRVRGDGGDADAPRRPDGGLLRSGTAGRGPLAGYSGLRRTTRSPFRK